MYSTIFPVSITRSISIAPWKVNEDGPLNHSSAKLGKPWMNSLPAPLR
jgi:hypothetical protein